MKNELLYALVTFAFVTSVTPGPNNLMLMASGANFGYRRTIPHMFGVSLGFALMVGLVGAGLTQVFDKWPVTYIILKTLSIVYLLWLAWKISQTGRPGDRQSSGQPLSFLQAAAFQWVNPKAWAMALAAISVYAPSGKIYDVALVSLVFGAVNLPSINVWILVGRELSRFLTKPKHLVFFNWFMAALLVATLYPVFFELLPQ